MQPRAGVYARISRVRVNSHEETLGVERQLPPCRDLCERLGWDIAETYVDNDLSAFSATRRLAYEQMLADARAGVLDVIVAWDADRLTRRPVENEALIDLSGAPRRQAGHRHRRARPGHSQRAP